MQLGARSISFTVPAGAGAYAPEIIYCRMENDAKGAFDVLAELTTVIESLPAGAQVEVDLLKPGLDPSAGASWLTALKIYNALGLQAVAQLAAWAGVRVRAKSGGAAGACAVHCSWW